MRSQIKVVPIGMRTKQDWIDAVTKNIRELDSFLQNYDKDKDGYNDILLAAVNQYGDLALMEIGSENWNNDLFMAAVNKDINTLYLIEEYQETKNLTPDDLANIISIAKDKYGVDKIFGYLPSEMLTYEICLEGVKQKLSFLEVLQKPENRKGINREEYNQLCSWAMNEYGYSALQYIPSQLRTYDMYFALLKSSHPFKLYFDKLGDPKNLTGLKADEKAALYLAAIEIHGGAVLGHIVPEMRTYELCLAAVNNDISALNLIKSDHERPLLTPDKYAAIISMAESKYGKTILHEFNTYYECLEAIKKDPSALGKLAKPDDRKGLSPDDYNKLCLEALDIHGNSIFNYILPEMWTYKLCIAAVTQDKAWLKVLQNNRDQIQLTPDEYQQVHLEAIKVHNYHALDYCPPEFLTYDIFLDLIKNDIYVLKFMDKPEHRKNLTPEEYHKICLTAIAIYGSYALRCIDPEALNEELYLMALDKDVNILSFISDQVQKKLLKEDVYLAFCQKATKKYGIGDTFPYLPPEMITYDVCLEALNHNVNVLNTLNDENKRKKLTTEQYNNLCLLVLKYSYPYRFDPNLNHDMLKNFINRYNKFNNQETNDIKSFFEKNMDRIFEAHKLLGDKIYLVMEKMLSTSTDNLNRFVLELGDIAGDEHMSGSKNVLRFLDNIDYKDALEKTSHLKLYLLLSNDEKQKINILLDDKQVNIEKIINEIRELIIKRFYTELNIPYKQENLLNGLSDEQLANFALLFAAMNREPDESRSKIFFSMLKMHLTDMPYSALHQPDVMINHGNSDDYLVEMAQHNKELREKLAACGVDVDKAFFYKKQTPLTFDEHHKKRIMELSASIYNKIKAFVADNESDKEKIGKNITNFLTQIEKGQNKDEYKILLNMLSESSLTLLGKIANGVLKDQIKDEYEELMKLAPRPKVLTNYEPREFRIEMWDKSKFETFFLGDHLSCCLATNGSKKCEYAPRMFDDALLMPVIIDATTNLPVCGAWLFLGYDERSKEKKEIDVVANFFEINAGIASNKQLMDFLVVNLLSYIGQFSEDIHASEFIMRPLGYGMIPDFNQFGSFSKTDENKLMIEKIGGYFNNDPYYLNATETTAFYRFDPTKFHEQLRKHILLVTVPENKPEPEHEPVPELGTQKFANLITMGFVSTPNSLSTAAPAEESPRQAPGDSIAPNNNG